MRSFILILLASTFVSACGSKGGSSTSSVAALDPLGNAASNPIILEEIPDLENSADSDDTVYPLVVSGQDPATVRFSTEVLNPNIAVASIDADSDTLHVRALRAGKTTIQITAIGANSIAVRTLQFTARDVTRAESVAISDTTAAAIRITNPMSFDQDIRLTHNGFQYFLNDQEIAQFVKSMPAEFAGETFPRKLWRFIRDRTYHNVSLDVAIWVDDPMVVINSLGYGLCHQVASSYVRIAKAAGYDARVWGLTGHVVQEVSINNHWEIYDTDLSIYYHLRDGSVASLSDLTANPSLIYDPTTPLLDPNLFLEQYAKSLADIYSSTGDNFDGVDFLPKVPATVQELRIPANSTLVYPGHWTDAPLGYNGSDRSAPPYFTQAALTVPAGFVGQLRAPWVLWDIQGDAEIEIGGVIYSAGSNQLRASLQSGASMASAVNVKSSQSEVKAIYLINAMEYVVAPANSVSVSGLHVGSLTVDSLPIAPEVSAHTELASTYQKPIAPAIL